MSATIESLAPPVGVLQDRPLRVLLVTQVSGGGAGRHFLDLARELTAEQVQVTGIYAPRKLDAHFLERLSAGELPAMHELHMRRAVHPLDTTDLWRMVRMIRRLGPFDLIHGHSSKGGALARLAARQLGIPSVYTPHAMVTLDPNLRSWQRSFYGRIERWLARDTAAIIAVSADEADHVRTLGIEPHKVHVVPNGIERPDFPARDEVRARLGFSHSDVVIGYVGRLAPQKAPDVLLDACAEVFQQRPQARLVMVGGGPLASETRRLVERLGLESRVRLLGDVVATDVMPAFDLFCLSSRYEAMPYVLLEALAAGLPIVSTRVGGATMCVDPDRNGSPVPAGDAGALAAALAALVDDPLRRQRCAAASRTLAADFSAKEMVRRTLDVYRSVLPHRAHRLNSAGSPVTAASIASSDARRPDALRESI